MMEQEDHEWELSKENVQPLREGRCMSILAAALHSDQDVHTQSQREQQNNFELELRTYNGDDPFDVWDRYIKWTEQNFPRGGQDGQQIILIERCLREFQKNEKYLNDKRYIRLWTKFACYSDDPVVLYKYMYDNSIGERCALFYVEWASAVERKGDMKTADQVYNLGLKLAAEPKELLNQSHQQFQSRVARNISLQIVESQNPGLDFGETEEKRSTLARLKPKGASHVVGASRTGAAVLGSAGSLKDVRGPVAKQVPSKGIPIYCDNENGSQGHIVQTHEWQSLPVRHVDNLENDKKPGAWTSAKVKQKPGSVPSVPQACPFPIHIDQESENHPDATPRKTTVIGHTQPLSCHKASRTDVLSSVKPQETKEASNEVVMYQKEKIYNGLSELSFEELRAIKYWKKKKERESEVLRLQQEEERRRTEEALRKQLQWTNERLARVEAIVLSMNRPLPEMADVPAIVPGQTQPNVQEHPSPNQSQTASIDSNNSSAVCTSSHISATSTSSAEAASCITSEMSSDNQTPINLLSLLPGSGSSQSSTQIGLPRKENTSVSMSATKRTPIFNSASTYSSLLSNSSLSQKLGKSFGSSSIEKSLVPSATPSSLISTDHAPNAPGQRSSEAAGVSGDQIGNSLESQNLSSVNVSLSTSLGKTPDTRSFKKKSISAPSPTVCTKEALQCVYGMFSAPIQEEENNDSLLSLSSQAHFPNGCRRPLDLSMDASSGPPAKRQNLKAMAQLPSSEKTQSANVGNIGLQIYQDAEPMQHPAQSVHMASARKGLQIYQDQPMAVASTTKGLQIYQDQPMASASKGLQIYQDQPTAVASTTKGLQTYQDQPMASASKGLSIYQDQPMASTSKGLQIYQDQPMAVASTTKGLQIYQDQPMSSASKGLHIYQDQPMASASKGLQVYQDQPRAVASTTKGLQVYQDQPMASSSKGLQIYQDQPNAVASTSKGLPMAVASTTKGLQIYQDEPQIKENVLALRCEQKAVRRGLVFKDLEDVALADDGKTLNVNNDFTIVSQAFSEMTLTLAPLESFSLTTKMASTPKHTPLSPLADHWEPTILVDGALNSLPATVVSNVAPQGYEGEEFHVSGNVLSPIIEGGESGSSEESAQQSQNTHLKSSETIRTEKSGRTRLDSLQEEQSESSQWTLGVGKTPLPKITMPEPVKEEVKDEEEDDDVAELPVIPNGNKLEKDLLDSSCHHVIDTTAYHSPDDSLLDLSNSITLDPKDPFDEETIAGILSKLDPPLSSFENYYFFNNQMQCISKNALFWVKDNLGFFIINAIGEGGNATVYEVKDINITDSFYDEPENPVKAMKVQSPPCYWEFYISRELRKRLNKLEYPMDVRTGIIEIFQAFFYEDSSVLIMDLVDKGSLLNLVNKYKNVPGLLSDVEPFAVLLTIELLHMFEQIHKCEIIHGDVKPDNFLLKALPDIKSNSKDPKEVFGKQLRMVKLIDYGQSIDMRQFKNGTTFTAQVSTSGFQCIEMRTQRPWTYQTDLFGLAGTIHVVLFGTYMNVFQENGTWKTTGNFLRKWNVPLWKNLFNVLLNIPSCHQQPDLAELRKPFEEYFISSIKNYSKWIYNVQRL